MVIRPASADDYGAFVRLFPELHVDDPLPSPQTWAAVLAPSSVVAEEAGTVLGYSTFNEYDDSGYVRNVVVAPEARRRGVGRALMTAVAARLREAGKTSWRLNVRLDNEAALALYDRLGFSLLYQTTVMRLPWDAVDRLPPGDAVTRPLAPERDAVLEQRFELPRGQLAHSRRVGRILIEAVSGPDHAPLGVGVFDRLFRAAVGFRVAETEAVRPLLSALRAHAAGEDEVTIVAEDDAELVDLLAQAGATVRDEVVQLRGSL